MSDIKYNHREIEAKWQKRWMDERVFSVTTTSLPTVPTAGASGHLPSGRGGRSTYVLDMFPYPSGDGLHVGHPEGYTATDIYSRYLRMTGVKVLHPMGWDAFGLPAENYAIKQGVHPAEVTAKNIANFKRQIQSLGFSYDWDREVNTTDPKYYKWTQWIFLQLFKRDLAYEAESPIWWCPADKTGLANEEVVDGKCDRCGAKVEKKMLRQWMLKITAYADRLLAGLDKMDWPVGIKTLQRNWIGKSEGAEVRFKIKDLSAEVIVFTTRPDTLFGATYLVLAPEHELVKKITTPKQKKVVAKYKKDVAAKSDLERTALEKEKTGVFTGAYAVNPVNNEKIPVWIADYVLSGYGTGAIMAVPAHDERDFAFAKKYELPIPYVIMPHLIDPKNSPRAGQPTKHRQTIQAIVHDPKTDKYLCLKWKEQPWTTFIVGGVESGEDLVTAAKREILEETGFEKVTMIKQLGGPVQAEYFAAHKGENRVADATAFLFRLDSKKQDPISAEEAAKHEIIWLSLADIRPETMNCVELPHWLGNITNDLAYTGEGLMMNSGKFDGLPSEEGRKKIVAWLAKEGKAKTSVNYKLRDWVFSRQRYWGEPIPLVHCAKCGVVPVPEDQLPLELPNVKNYEPTGTGESPLALIKDWVNTTCPKCGDPAKRETNTMPQWAGSCWYYLRYLDPHNNKELASPESMKAWLPVDLYVGGAEHAVLHLLYARFWHMVLFDAGVIPKDCGDEPFLKLKNQGLILGPDGEKMSKSRGNVINPDEIVEKYGADTLRMYEMFMGPFEDAKPWDTNGIVGIRRFLDRVYKLVRLLAVSDLVNETTSRHIHQTVKKLTEGITNFKFNTAVSDLMIFFDGVNAKPDWRPKLNSKREFEGTTYDREAMEKFLKLLSPFAPHMTEELWSMLGNKTMLAQEKWPAYDLSKISDTTVTIAVQVMGRLRATLTMPAGSVQTEVESAAKANDNVKKFLTSEPKKVIYVQDKLINFVV